MGRPIKLSRVTLAARIFEILKRAPRPLKVFQINQALANSSWWGKCWYADGVSHQRIMQFLRRMRARGLTERASSGWRVMGNAPDVADLHEFVAVVFSRNQWPRKKKLDRHGWFARSSGVNGS